MLARLLIILLIAGVVYALLTGAAARIGGAMARDPRWRYLFTGFGVLAAREVLRRAVPSLGRWLAMLRWFR